MKKKLTYLLIFFLPLLVYGQIQRTKIFNKKDFFIINDTSANTNSFTNKMAISLGAYTNNEFNIDSLALFYDNVSIVLFHTSFGDIMSSVKIEFNSELKPQAVRLTGESSQIDCIVEFLSEIVSKKKEEGYVCIEPCDKKEIKNSIISIENAINSLFVNGKRYCIIKAGKILNSTINKYWFEIENGDYSRKVHTNSNK